MALSRKKPWNYKDFTSRTQPRCPYLLGVAEVDAELLAGFFFFLLCFDFLVSDVDLPASVALVASGAFAGALAAAGAVLGAGAEVGACAAADSAKALTRRAVRSLLIVAVFRGWEVGFDTIVVSRR